MRACAGWVRFAPSGRDRWRMQPETNTNPLERYTIEVDGVAITTYHPQQAIALARQIAGHRGESQPTALPAPAGPASMPREPVRAQAPRPPARPAPSPTSSKRRSSLATHGYKVGSLLVLGNGPKSKQSIMTETGLSATDVNRGFVSLTKRRLQEPSAPQA